MVLGGHPADTANIGSPDDTVDSDGTGGPVDSADTVAPEGPVLPETREDLATLGVIGESALEKNVAMSPTPIQH